MVLDRGSIEKVIRLELAKEELLRLKQSSEVLNDTSKRLALK